MVFDRVHVTRAAVVLALLLTAPVSAAVRLPLAFEKNAGQTDASVAFLARGTHHTIFLTPTEIVLAGRERAGTLRVRLVGASPEASIRGTDRLPGIVSYFTGDDPSRWKTGLPTYKGVDYDGVYPGIGLSIHTKRRHLEYDFTVAPGADPGVIALEILGANKIKVDRRGDLVARTAGGSFRQRRPLAYQRVGDHTVPVTAAFERRGRTRVAFRVGSYDRAKSLVIDPVLLYATYLGGSGFETSSSVAVDAAGSAYVLGDTASTNFPTAAQGLDAGGGGPSDVFVAKVDPSGSSLIYVAILGGSVSEYVRVVVSVGLENYNIRGGIAVDAGGNAYISGTTDSSDFPTTPGAYDTSFNGPSWDAFVAKLGPTGSTLVYSTYLGAAWTQFGSGLAVDGNGNAYVTGVTLTSFPLTVNAVDLTFAGPTEAFIGVLDATGSQLLYGSYLGGSGGEGGTAIATDGAGNVVVTGTTYSADFPTSANALDATRGGTQDAFVTKIDIDTTTSDLAYSSYLGGSANDDAVGLFVDATGYAYVAGWTYSTDFPVTAASFDATHNGDADAFVLKLGLGGEGLAYGTFLGGANPDQAHDVTVDGSGRAYVAGASSSIGWPTANPLQASHGGGSGDAVLAVVSPGGDSLAMSTFLGGPGGESAEGVAVDSGGNVYLAGSAGPGFPTFHALQPSFGGGPSDALIAKLHPTSATTTTSLPQPTTTSSTTTSTLPSPTCPASADPGCVDVSGSGSRLIVREDTPGRESLLLRTGEGPALSATDLGDPALGGTAYVLCLYDENDTLAQSYVVDRAGDACGARPCWKLIGWGPIGGPNHDGYRYLDRTRAADGIKTLKLRAAPAARVNVRGGNGGGTANLPLGTTAGLQNATSATAQLRGSDAPLCLSVTLGHVRRAGATVFVATD